MFLTTEPSLSGKNYHALKVVHSNYVQFLGGGLLVNAKKNADALHYAIEYALGAVQNEATNLGADGVIGIHHTVSSGDMGRNAFVVTVMGTAIKFY